jgi:hypothetical protein
MWSGSKAQSCINHNVDKLFNRISNKSGWFPKYLRERNFIEKITRPLNTGGAA